MLLKLTDIRSNNFQGLIYSFFFFTFRDNLQQEVLQQQASDKWQRHLDQLCSSKVDMNDRKFWNALKSLALNIKVSLLTQMIFFNQCKFIYDCRTFGYQESVTGAEMGFTCRISENYRYITLNGSQLFIIQGRQILKQTSSYFHKQTNKILTQDNLEELW